MPRIRLSKRTKQTPPKRMLRGCATTNAGLSSRFAASPALDKLESGRVAKIASAIDRINPLSQARDDANNGARDDS